MMCVHQSTIGMSMLLDFGCDKLLGNGKYINSIIFIRINTYFLQSYKQ